MSRLHPSVALCAAFLLAVSFTTTAGAQTATTTLLNATPTTLNQGESAALTAAVQPAVSGGAAPTGTITFLYGSRVLAAVPLNQGIAEYVASSAGIPPGAFVLTAKYSGNSTYSASTSAPTTVTISKYATSTSLLASPTSIDEGQSGTLTATVTDTNGPVTPTGTVTFSAAGKTLATAPLVNGVATFSGSSANFVGGAYTITAAYSGDALNASSTGSAPVTIVGTTATTLTTNSSVYASGQTASLTATVTATSGGTPSGTVKFYAGSTLLASVALSGGKALLTASTKGYPSGTYALTADYVGSTYFQASSGSATATLDPAFTVTPGGNAISPSATAQFSISPSVTGTVNWYVNGVLGGNATTGTVSTAGLYTAPATATAVTALVTASLASDPSYVTPAASVYVIPAGTVAKSNNVTVATYTINVPAGANVSVNFGQTTSYGLNTWQQPAPSGGGAVSLYVAGMIQQTTYHLQGSVQLPGGITFTDADHTFKTGLYPGPDFPAISVLTDTTPQPGIEMADQVTSPNNQAFALDLDGNVIWDYPVPDITTGDVTQPLKVLPNGHFLMIISQNSNVPVSGTIPANSLQVVREVDLGSNIIQQVDIATINQNLITAGYSNINLLTIHHEVTVLPNGHWLLLGNILVTESGLTGYTSPVNVLGDVIVDLDPSNNYAVDWVWNTFDHLDVNRHPYEFPDWTHANAIVYSPDDGNILLSMRHQNWILKLNYADGTGDGSILWHFGAQGDFTLENSTSLDDWQYAQHGPSFTTTNTTGVFGLALMDNGDDRGVYTNTECGTGSNPACYTTAPIFQIDETNMTVTKTFVNNLGTADYSFFGGYTTPLANGDLEADICSIVLNGKIGNSLIQETTVGSSPEVTYQLEETGVNLYRAFRVGSLYPGVTWTPGAGLTGYYHKLHHVAPGQQPLAAPPDLHATPAGLAFQ